MAERPVPSPHKELAFIIDRALASPYGVPYDESHEAREALGSLVEQNETFREALRFFAAMKDPRRIDSLNAIAEQAQKALDSYPASSPYTEAATGDSPMRKVLRGSNQESEPS